MLGPGATLGSEEVGQGPRGAEGRGSGSQAGNIRGSSAPWRALASEAGKPLPAA